MAFSSCVLALRSTVYYQKSTK